MSQTEREPLETAPSSEQPELLPGNSEDKLFESPSTDLFSEVLSSGKEIEGLFGKQKRDEMQGKKSVKKKGANGLKDPLSLMKERVAIYNKKMEPEYQLTVDEEELTFGGYLTFTYNNGYQTLSEKVKLTNSNTTASVVPTLLRLFLPSYDTISEPLNGSSGQILLSQGGSERELEATEKPLEIALDCSTKGLSPPAFTLRTSVSLLLNSTTSPQRRLENKHSALSLQASSLSSLGHTSSDSDSPKVSSPQIMFEDHDSLYSYSSTGSMAPSQPNSNGGSRSPHAFLKTHSRSKSRSQSKNAQKLAFDSMYHKLSEPVLSVSSSPAHNQSTPEMQRKGLTKNKSKVGNFMEGVARSLKSSKKKMRPPSIYPENNINEMPDPKKSALVSPKMAEKRISMPTVFHIYYSKARNTQLYKSVLVSEDSTARDVIKQSLERYGMKFMSADSFNLYEVIGRWEAMNRGLFESGLERSLVIPLSTADAQQTSGKNKASSFEEFVECYTRKLGHEEKPYEIQFFHEPQSGYTRRFELRSIAAEDDGSTSSLSQDQFTPTTPLFGSTSHNLNGTRRSRSRSQDTFEFLTETDDGSETAGAPVRGGKLKDNMRLGLSHSLVDCSSPDSLDILTPMQPQSETEPCSLYPSVTSGVFLLNLQLVPSRHEFMVYNLLYEEFILKNLHSLSSRTNSKQFMQGRSEVFIGVQDVTPGVTLCTIQRNNQRSYSIEPTTNCSISLNGANITEKCNLHHGDLIKISNTHLFMFQNHSRKSTSSVSSDTSPSSWPYKWTPAASSATLTTTEGVESVEPSHETVSSQSSTTRKLQQPSVDTVREPLSATTPQVVFISPREEVCSLPTLPEIDLTEGNDQVDSSTVTTRNNRTRSYSDTHAFQRKKRRNSLKSIHQQQQGPRPQPQAKSSGQLSINSNQLGVFPADRRLMFSYTAAEEDTLLELLINELDPTKVIFSLAPAYILAMCMEYSARCSGVTSASRLGCKAVEKIQGRVDKITDQITSWQPKTYEPTHYPSINEIHAPLYSILFWLANTLEFYNFLLSQEVLDLSIMIQGENGETNEDNALTVLEKMLEHMFQQAFYSVCKVLYVVLPRVLEESDADRSSCVHYVVDFLKRTLEMMFELHIHTDMVAQFFANIFFFLNVSMFNTLIEKGPGLDLFEYSLGLKLRAKVDVLENWAGKEGFRDGPLQFFAVFSSAVDLIAMPPDQLLSLSWSMLREDFPALLPSQLQYILAHYLLPEYCEQCPVHWTPSPEDEASKLKEDSVLESFETHPQFEIPIGGYLLDLDSQSCDDHMLHEFVDALQRDLRKKQKNINIVGIKKKSSTAPSIPTMVYSTSTYPPRVAGGRRRPLLDIDEIVTVSNGTEKNGSHENSEKSTPKAVSKDANNDNVVTEPCNQLRGRVKSIVEPQFTAPEKLTILNRCNEEDIDSNDDDDGDDGDLTSSMNSVKLLVDGEGDSSAKRRTLSLQRGNKGFGFNTETNKDPITGADKVVITSLTPDGGLEKLMDLFPGDEIVAVDDMQLPCNEIQTYIKNAEEEISLTVCTSSSSGGRRIL